jgi:adenine-specific DNA methylase/DNA modification methylase
MRFIGSKESLIPFITETTECLGIRGRVFFDIFSGTTQVAQRFKKMGYHIISNDNLYFSYLLQRTYIENNVAPLFLRLVSWLREKGTYDDSKTGAQNVIDFLNAADAIKGYVFENYARDGKYQRMYFSNENAQKIDGILSLTDLWRQNALISEMEEHILKTALIEAIPFVSNISGTYGAYLKHWDERAFKPLTLTVPQFILSTKQHFCFQKDANELIRDFDTDILYLDPPYNARQYISNYHVLETIARNDKAELKGKTGLRKDACLYKSKFSQEKHCVEALKDLIMAARAKYIFMSYNSEGIIPEREIERIFKKKGSNYRKFEKSYRRFKSNSQGKPKRAVTEYIYFVEVPGVKHYFVDLEEQQGQPSRAREQLPLIELTNGDSSTTSRRLGIERGESGIYDIRNKLNNLTGKEWVYRTNSVEILDTNYDEASLLEFMTEILETKYSTRGKESFSHTLRARNPTPKPPQLMKRLIDFFTKESGWVLDPFMGVGGTLLGASLINRNAVGIELSQEYVDIYKEVCRRENLKEQIAIVGDARDIDKFPEVRGRVFDLILTDPPYSNMMTKRKTGEATKKGGNTEPTPFTTYKEDIGNEPLPIFLEELKTIISKSCDYLKSKGYLLIFTKDFQPTKEYHGMLHSDLVHKLLEISYLRYKGCKIWYDKTVNLYPYGYPFAYVGNQLHQFILIFRKEGAKGEK